MEVDMATTKVFAGVPIYNYHMANPGGMTPSLAELAQQKSWVLSLSSTATDADEAAICSWLKNRQTGANCSDQGHPSEGGEAFIAVYAAEDELQLLLAQFSSVTSFAEPNGGVSAVDPEDDTSLIEDLLSRSPPWGIDRIDMGGTDGKFTVPSTSSAGFGAHVYVADTGIRTTHTDFGGRAFPAYDAFKSGSDKTCPASDTSCAMDRHGHGTHCAGTIGGKTYGVAKRTTLHAAKVLSDRGSGSYSGIIGSLDYVMTKGSKPAIWSASLGGPGTSHAMKKAIDDATKAGVLVSVAAGNSNSDACSFSPAFVPTAVTVGATSSSDQRAGFSNYGKCLDIYAPGVGVLSAGHASDTATRSMSGTSMACPHVSGVAALLFSDFPGSSLAQIESQLTSFAQSGVVKDAKTGSPNLLLHIPDYTPGGTITTVTTTTSTTTTTSPPPGTFTCSFESSSKPYCGLWKDVGGDKFDWTRAGRTPSYNTGPGQASHGSYFLFIEASWPRRQNDNAILSTVNSYPISAGGSLSFDYHMFGSSVGFFKVFATDNSGTKTTLFATSGNKGNKWQRKSIDLSRLATGSPVKLNFEATRSSSWSGDISIDNVNLFIPVGAPPTTIPPPASTTIAPTTMAATTQAPTTMAPTTTKAQPPTTVSPPSLDKKIDELIKKVDSMLKLLNDYVKKTR
jgi:subtilisin family serine protease